MIFMPYERLLLIIELLINVLLYQKFIMVHLKLLFMLLHVTYIIIVILQHKLNEINPS